MLPFTLQQLRILKAIESERSFTKAADILYISQPSLSKQIKKLEESLSVCLINREKHRISLTENGLVLVEYSERILALCEEGCRALMDLQNGERGNLIVGASQTIGTYLMPKIIALFLQTHSQINLEIQVNSTRTIAKSILSREIDIALVGGNISQGLKKHLIIDDFVYDELILIISKSHPFARQKIIKKEELYCLKFITLNPNSTIKQFIDDTLTQNEIDPKQLHIILQLNSIEAIKTTVSVGLGAAFVSSSAVEKEIQLKTVKILRIKDIQITRKLSIISHPESYKSRAFSFFYRELYRLKKQIEN